MKMKNKLQQYFPMIRTEGEVLKELREHKELWQTFCEWEDRYQKEYLDICTGVKGLKLLYDTYFKAVMNPDTRPERLNDFLSEILGRKIKILKVLPNESARIASESSLLIMDIVVQFEDGSIANVEVQKVGYLFPGQRCACYSSDLLLRQYKRIRLELGKSFTYKEIQKVYTIVLPVVQTQEVQAAQAQAVQAPVAQAVVLPAVQAQAAQVLPHQAQVIVLIREALL